MRRVLEGALRYNANGHNVAPPEPVQAGIINCASQFMAVNSDFGVAPGGFFSFRNAGNLVVPYAESRGTEMAYWVELAVRQKLEHIIVMGHSDCLAMGELLNTDSIALQNHCLRHGVKAKESFRERMNYDSALSDVDRLSQMNVVAGLDNLATYPDIKARLAAGIMHLHGWWMDSKKHRVLAYDSKANQFSPIDDDYVQRTLARIG